MNEYKKVDLGLPSGLKWADRNVGAESPEAYGDYFMWGSTTPDTNNVCDWEHAPFNNGSSIFDKAHFKEYKSKRLTDKGVLKAEYDAATQIIGSSWRMPTLAEIYELIDGTTQIAEEVNGVYGMIFTSKVNGNSIFIPFTGYRDGTEFGSIGYGGIIGGPGGYVWSSSLDEDYAYYSRYLYFNDGYYSYICHDYPYYGFVVRGVHE